MSYGFNVGDLIATMGLDDRDFRAGIERTQKNVTKIDGTLKKVSQSASLNVNRLRGSFVALATQATGTNPAIARLADVVGVFAIGSATMAGVLAGLAAVSFAWKKLGEDTREATKNLNDWVSKMTEAGRIRGLGGPIRAGMGAAIGARAGLDAERTRLQGEIDSGFLEPESVFRAEVRIEQLTAEMADYTVAIEEAGRQLQDAKAQTTKMGAAAGTVADTLLDLNLRADRAAEQVEDMMRPLFAKAKKELGEVLGPAGSALSNFKDIARAKAAGGLSKGGPGGRLDAGASGFTSAIKGAFSAASFASMGAGLATNLLSAAVGKAIAGVGSLFTTSAERLAEVMEKNTRALAATGNFLRARVEGSGFAGKGNDIIAAITEVLNKVAVGDLSDSDKVTNFRREVEKALGLKSGEFLDWKALGKALGIDTSTLNAAVLDQLAQQLAKAGFSIEDLGDIARDTAEALRNVPEGFKIAQAVFDSTVGASVAGGGGLAGVGTQNFAPGSIQINASGMDPEQLWKELQRVVAREQVRGGGSGFTNRGPA